MKKTEYRDEFLKAMDYAYRLLAGSQKTAGEITSRLSMKKFNKETIKRVVEDLREKNYLNDMEFAVDFIGKKLSGEAGREAIRYGLINKGLNRETADEYINAYFSEHSVDENEIARNALNKRFKGYGKPDKRKMSMKLRTFLAGRGFSTEVISNVMEEWFEE